MRGAYDQWVTVETQARRLQTEENAPTFAFHRCLDQLNHFLVAYAISFGRDDVYEIHTSHLGWVIACGHRGPDGIWHFDNQMLMHPENIPRFAPAIGDERIAGIGGVIQELRNARPYITARLWFDLAKRQARTGDGSGRVVSLQTSFESLLFETWIMTTVDQEKAALQVGEARRKFQTFE